MESSKASDIPREKLEPLSEDYYSNATGQEAPACCSKCNVHCQKEENRQVHVRCVSSLRTGVEEQICNRKENEKHEDIGKLSEFCTNGGRIKDMQTTIGELRRVCILGDAKWTEEELRTKACNYVHPIHRHRNNDSEETMHIMPEASERDGSKGLGGSLSMVVDTFVDESVRRNLASSIWCELDGSDLERLGYYYECVAEFGFNHIIAIGEMLYGLLFLDCYGRVFQWEDMEQVIWPMGNSLEESKSHEELVIWTVEDGVAYEESKEGQFFYNFGLFEAMLRALMCNIFTGNWV
ncbi:1188_t:CDS:2 [Paraglomus brasilianum]|uniref:1188_t:CDS:1 n=1 Tax=Paraglomus brasilianum TaxID=144538 RepID=A0A9N9B6J8_9GLOM|nr:1188_t:CDS:2 [Paraglomus brasilianum]